MTNRDDIKGKRALFETPPIEIEDSLRDEPLVGRHRTDGREGYYSAGHHERGTGVITCSECTVRTRVTHIEMAVRSLAFSFWIPGRDYSRHIPCPACQNRTWCRVEWLA